MFRPTFCVQFNSQSSAGSARSSNYKTPKLLLAVVIRSHSPPVQTNPAQAVIVSGPNSRHSSEAASLVQTVGLKHYGTNRLCGTLFLFYYLAHATFWTFFPFHWLSSPSLILWTTFRRSSMIPFFWSLMGATDWVQWSLSMGCTLWLHVGCLWVRSSYSISLSSSSSSSAVSRRAQGLFRESFYFNWISRKRLKVLFVQKGVTRVIIVFWVNHWLQTTAASRKTISFTASSSAISSNCFYDCVELTIWAKCFRLWRTWLCCGLALFLNFSYGHYLEGLESIFEHFIHWKGYLYVNKEEHNNHWSF